MECEADVLPHMNANKIKQMICIMPKEDFEKYQNKFKIEMTNLEYNGHEEVLMESQVEEYDKMCKRLLELQDNRENTLVVCNNGYQRSLPFLCYYLLNHHQDEYPTLQRCLDMILSQVDKTNYMDF